MPAIITFDSQEKLSDFQFMPSLDAAYDRYEELREKAAEKVLELSEASTFIFRIIEAGSVIDLGKQVDCKRAAVKLDYNLPRVRVHVYSDFMDLIDETLTYAKVETGFLEFERMKPGLKNGMIRKLTLELRRYPEITRVQGEFCTGLKIVKTTPYEKLFDFVAPPELSPSSSSEASQHR